MQSPQVPPGTGSLLGPTATAYARPNDTTNICFDNVWNDKQAIFRLCFLPFLSAIPTFVAVLILLWQVLRLAIQWRPRWTRPFVEEVTELPVIDELFPKRFWNIQTVIVVAVAIINSGLQLAIPIRSRSYIDAAPAITWIAACGLLLVFRPRTVPISVLVIFVLQALAMAVVLTHGYALEILHRNLDIATLAFNFVGICVLLCMPFRDPHFPAKDISQPFSEPTAVLRSPEDNLTLWQYMTVSWMAPLINKGRKQQLQDEDVWQLAFEFHHQRLHDSFRLLKGTVVQRLVQANIIDIVILTLLGVFELILEFSSPLLLQKLLASMEDLSAPTRTTVVYAALTLAVRLVQAQSSVFSLWHGRRCYERSRGEMITMLYEKTLARKISFAPDKKPEESDQEEASNGHTANGNGEASHDQASKSSGSSLWTKVRYRMASIFGRSKPPPAAKEPASMGKILNLMRNDVYEVAQRFWEIQPLIQKPLSVIFSIALVIRLLGLPSMLAVLVVFLAQIVNFGLAQILVHFEKKRRVATDGKLQVISQFVEAIRHLRWYGWQGSWLEQIMKARQKELNLRVVSSAWNLAINFNNIFALEMTPVLAFFAYTVIAKQELRVDLAFPAIEVLQLMIQNLRDIPQLIIVIINAWVAVGRIEEFMAEPDRQKMNTEALAGDEISLEDASFSWPGAPITVLKNINLSFPTGLTVVFGEVASGKTALLQALLGEMDMLDGKLIRPHVPIAYCAQTPWLQSMSIRENILFGAPYDDARYRGALDACALVPDLAEFKAGDLSLIGENGIGLSGGQRARVALARAIYSTASILLLDDPISALDQQTAESIVQKCFGGSLLHGRTIILITHRVDLVSDVADQMIQLENGCASVLSRDSAELRDLKRLTSLQSEDAEDREQLEEKNAAAVPDKFIEEEHRADGSVQISVYWEYIKSGKLRWWSALALAVIIWRIATFAQVWFLKEWGESYKRKSNSADFLTLLSDPVKAQWDLTHRLPPPDENIRPWLLGFFLFALWLCVFYTLAQIFMIVVVYMAGKNMFCDAIGKVAGANFRFYDVTPVGRLMNRMTSDMGVLDGNLSQRFQQSISLAIGWMSSVFIIATVTPFFLAFAIVLSLTFVFIFLRFLPTSQSLRRLEMISLTPLMSNFGTLLNGLSTVRAFHAQRQFQDRVVRVVDTFQKMDHFYWSLQAWLMYRFDTLSALSTFLIAMLALATSLTAGQMAFVLMAANRFVGTTHRLCKQYGQLQMEFVSVERVVELLHLEQEPTGDVHPPAWWPSFSGNVVFDNVTVRYAPHLDPALENISFTIKGGSKTAVIGRTGSGKSTLALSMLATILPEAGKILVDNVDLAQVDKQLLRTKVTFLAQDPVLFPGTMRQNLDPTEEHSDEDCDVVLQRVCERQGWSLDTKIEGGGKNLSQGQRQLVGLARAVLRRSAIIILDEATASIDRETAMQIQQVMYEEMKDSTVITIAHRLEAVKNADYCIILGKGKVIQQGPASEMLADYREDMIDEADGEE